jgi:hypothetical protein
MKINNTICCIGEVGFISVLENDREIIVAVPLISLLHFYLSHYTFKRSPVSIASGKDTSIHLYSKKCRKLA